MGLEVFMDIENVAQVCPHARNILLLTAVGRKHSISSFGEQCVQPRMCYWFGPEAAWTGFSTMLIPVVKV
jgi:hypothetical protein